ncbi:MAG: flagellar basal body P-ring formation chaperone FlgA [Desulfovermiculus sp.]
MCRFRFFLFPALLVFLLLWAANPAWGLRIEFKPEAKVEGSVLRLRDVAYLSPEEAAQRYGDIELFHLRSNQGVQTYRASTLRAYIRQQVGQESKITWAGEKSITVRRAGGELIDHQEMQALIQDYLEESLDHPGVTQVTFTPGMMPSPFTVQDQNWECTVRPSDQNLVSARRFSLIFSGSGRVLRNVTVRGEVQVRGEVAVAVQDLGRHQTIAREDVQLRERVISRRVEPVFDLQEAVGKRVQRSTQADSVIDAQDIARPHLVRRRQPVTLIVRKGKMVISASGIAQEDGAKMDRVCVENARSGQEVYGHVVGKNIVEVAF